MTADEYLQAILRREDVNTGMYSPVRGCLQTLLPYIQAWAGVYLVSISPSGSFIKGTANKSSTDIDVFISLTETTPDTLAQIYQTLFNKMAEAGGLPRKQNVSIGVTVNGYKVDLVPAKRQEARGEDHSLYKNKGDTWVKTNIAKHIDLVAGSGRIDEIRILKLWRTQKGLDIASFYLELTVINALSATRYSTLGERVMAVLEYIRDYFTTARVVDPANSNNVLSDELTNTQKQAVANMARTSRAASTWEEIVR